MTFDEKDIILIHGIKFKESKKNEENRKFYYDIKKLRPALVLHINGDFFYFLLLTSRINPNCYKNFCKLYKENTNLRKNSWVNLEAVYKKEIVGHTSVTTLEDSDYNKVIRSLYYYQTHTKYPDAVYDELKDSLNKKLYK